MPQTISRKELVAFTQIIISVLALATFGLLCWIQVFHLNYYLLGLQLLTMNIGLICFLFAFSPWFYLSNFALTRFHSRILCVTVLWILFLLLSTDLTLYILEIFLEILKIINQKMEFKGLDKMLLNLALILSCLIDLLLFCMNAFLTSRIAHKSNRNRQRRSSSNKFKKSVIINE